LKYAGIKKILLTHGITPELENRKNELNPEIFEFAREDVVYQI
jgi:hypothetical protein